MMNTDIHAIYLDLGDTFRIIKKEENYILDAKRKIAEMCGTDEDPEKFYDEVISPRYDVYREWALKYYCEAPEQVLWSRWLAYDRDPERIRKYAGELTYQYRQTKGRRVVVDGGIETVKELNRRGFAVGIISDLVGTKEIDEWLDADGLRPYFKTVQQSSVCYVRKPGPAIYYYAMDEVGIPAENSAFLGDNLDRDIIGAKAVNMGMTIAAKWGAKKYTLNEENRPDCVIFRFPQLLDLFPEPGKVNTEAMIPPEEAWPGGKEE